MAPAGGPDTGASGARDGWVEVAGGRLRLPDFLAECGRTLGDPAASIAAQRDVFVAGGLAALRRAPDGRLWTALGLRPVADGLRELWAELATAGRELLAGGAANFFFMQKPPGLRVRVEAAAAAAPGVGAALRARAEGWRAAGLLAEVTPSVYEPEAHLFGGPLSMRYVHRLFTVDSLAWLDFHAGAAGGTPAWAFSLAVLRALLDGLEVTGWEDLDVWDRIRRQAFRALPDAVTRAGSYAAAADGVRAAWAASGGTPAGAAADLVTRTRADLAVVTGEWLTGYFASPEAYVGPREACAFAAVYHWNRGGLSALQQGLLTEALADRRSR